MSMFVIVAQAFSDFRLMTASSRGYKYQWLRVGKRKRIEKPNACAGTEKDFFRVFILFRVFGQENITKLTKIFI